MITFEEARKIGIKACIEKLKDKSMCDACYSWGNDGDYAFCAVTGNDVEKSLSRSLILDSTSKFDYGIQCRVYYEDGHIEFYPYN